MKDMPTRIRRVATEMLAIYGDGASAEAANRAQDAKFRQQPEIEAMWNEVRSAIADLKDQVL